VLGALTTTVAATSSGCIGGSSWEETLTPQLKIYNGLEDEISASVLVQYVDSGDRVIDETVTVPASESHEYADPFPRNGRVELRLELGSGRENSFRWDASAERTESSRTAFVFENDIELQLAGP